ncbi:MAG: hypothetical protein AAGA58_01370 [Verrucomicrobiota bacterium]
MDETIWNKLKNFPLDDPESGLAFSDRLARENGWSKRFSLRVIDEYRKFLYLCASAGHPVTPSDEVDQAWHLHLCYTESYWNDLCKQTLGFPLHHGPTKGGAEEREKYHDWYRKTINSYQNHFQSEPPQDIWPPASVRFRRQDIRRIDMRTNLVIPKRRLAMGAFIPLSFLFITGCINKFASSDSNVDGSSVILFIGFCLFLLVLAVWVVKNNGGGGNGNSGTGGCGTGCGSSCGAGCGN